MTTPREQTIKDATFTALVSMPYTTKQAVESHVVFNELLTKVERHLQQAGWTPPPTPQPTRPSQTIPYLDN